MERRGFLRRMGIGVLASIARRAPASKTSIAKGLVGLRDELQIAEN